ncbi:MAG: GNAT family N-acetyltransferase [Chloroflexota bacterium]
MTEIYQANVASEAHRATVKILFEEYLFWANGKLEEHFDISFNIPEMIAGDMATLEKFTPPKGHLLLADLDGETAGLACIRQIRSDVAEIKRMYVRPVFRRRGVGRDLVEAAIAHSKQDGYNAVFLDSARFMKSAHALYQSCGFELYEEYPESEIPPEFRQNWVFMRYQIADTD